MHPPLLSPLFRFRKTCGLGCEDIVSKRLGSPYRPAAQRTHRCQACGGNKGARDTPRALKYHRTVRSRNSGTVVFVPAMRRLVPGHKLSTPAGEAGTRLFHQSGHDDLRLSVQLGATVIECSQPRRDLGHMFSFLGARRTSASANSDHSNFRQMRGKLERSH